MVIGQSILDTQPRQTLKTFGLKPLGQQRIIIPLWKPLSSLDLEQEIHRAVKLGCIISSQNTLILLLMHKWQRRHFEQMEDFLYIYFSFKNFKIFSAKFVKHYSI